MIKGAVSVQDHITVKSVNKICQSVITAVPSIIPETKAAQNSCRKRRFARSSTKKSPMEYGQTDVPREK